MKSLDMHVGIRLRRVETHGRFPDGGDIRRLRSNETFPTSVSHHNPSRSEASLLDLPF